MAYTEIQEAYWNDPLKMARSFWPQYTFYGKQVEIIESVRDNAETYVPAGNMLGKDFVAAFIVLWFFITRYQNDKNTNWVRVVTTSVADHHLNVLWAEIGRYIATSRFPLTHRLGGPLVVNHHEIRSVHDMAMSGGNAGSYIKGLVSAKGEGLQGHHAEYTLLVVDEASGGEDESYNMASTWAKYMLIIGNPHQCANFFYHGVTKGDLLA